jgi:hypothetical protein
MRPPSIESQRVLRIGCEQTREASERWIVDTGI